MFLQLVASLDFMLWLVRGEPLDTQGDGSGDLFILTPESGEETTNRQLSWVCQVELIADDT